MEKRRTIVWSRVALRQLENALTWISKESFNQAEKVEQAVLNKIEIASKNPEHFPPDKFKRNSPTYFRAFDTHSYRVSYKFDEKPLRMLRVRHVKQKPVRY